MRWNPLREAAPATEFYRLYRMERKGLSGFRVISPLLAENGGAFGALYFFT